MKKLRKWDGLLYRHPFWLYTACFVLCFGAVFGPFFLTHKTFICIGDSIQQHYPSFLYYGEKLREMFSGFFSGKGLQFPQWEYSIGLGVDVISTLSYYIIGEPLSLLSALFPTSLAPYGYSLMIALRLYFAGLAFSAFLKERNCDPLPGALAAVAYVFSGYGLRPAIFHSAFSIPMIDLPLLLMGAERLYKRKEHKVFLLAVFHSAVSSFYFFYMLVILVVLYSILRYLFLFWGQPLRGLGRWVLRFFLTALGGTALAMPILLPCLNSVFSSDRLLAVEQDMLLHSGEYYSSYAAGLLSVYEYNYFYVALGGPVIVCALLTLTAPRGQFREEKLAMAVMTVFTLAPFFGSMFNAFTYVTNRWIWAFIAGICFCAARGFSQLRHLKTKQLMLTCGLLVILTVLSLLPTPRKETSWIQLAFLWASYLLILFGTLRRSGKRWQPGAIALLTAAGILVTGADLFWPGESGNYRSYMSRTQANTLRLGEVEPIMAKIVDDPNYRTDSMPSHPYNCAILSGHGTASYYYSMTDPGTAQFQKAVYYSRPYGQQYNGPRQQSMLMSLLGVRYYAVTQGQTDGLPYGFDTRVATDGGYDIYENSYALPLVTLYDGVASPKEAGSPFALEQLMLQAAVTDEETSLPHAGIELTVEEIPFTWEQGASQNVAVGEGKITAEQDGGWIDIGFEPVQGKELCVVVTGLEGDLYYPTDGRGIGITVNCGDVENKMWTVPPTNNYYCGYKDFLISAGYQSGPQSSLRLTISRAGEYTFDSMKVFAVDPSFLEGAAAKLSASGVEDIRRGTNRISFSAHRDKPGMAFISIPFSKNWSVTVDGKNVPLHNVQCGLCGVEVPVGDHQVVMTYRCRPFWIGAAVSGVTAIFLLALVVLKKRRRNN